MYFEVASLEGFFCASLNLVLNENPLTSISSGLEKLHRISRGLRYRKQLDATRYTTQYSVQRTKKVQIDERTTTRLRPLHRDHDQI